MIPPNMLMMTMPPTGLSTARPLLPQAKLLGHGFFAPPNTQNFQQPNVQNTAPVVGEPVVVAQPVVQGTRSSQAATSLGSGGSGILGTPMNIGFGQQQHGSRDSASKDPLGLTPSYHTRRSLGPSKHSSMHHAPLSAARAWRGLLPYLEDHPKVSTPDKSSISPPCSVSPQSRTSRLSARGPALKAVPGSPERMRGMDRKQGKSAQPAVDHELVKRQSSGHLSGPEKKIQDLNERVQWLERHLTLKNELKKQRKEKDRKPDGVSSKSLNTKLSAEPETWIEKQIMTTVDEIEMEIDRDLSGTYDGTPMRILEQQRKLADERTKQLHYLKTLLERHRRTREMSHSSSPSAPKERPFLRQSAEMAGDLSPDRAASLVTSLSEGKLEDLSPYRLRNTVAYGKAPKMDGPERTPSYGSSPSPKGRRVSLERRISQLERVISDVRRAQRVETEESKRKIEEVRSQFRDFYTSNDDIGVEALEKKTDLLREVNKLETEQIKRRISWTAEIERLEKSKELLTDVLYPHHPRQKREKDSSHGHGGVSSSESPPHRYRPEGMAKEVSPPRTSAGSAADSALQMYGTLGEMHEYLVEVLHRLDETRDKIDDLSRFGNVSSREEDMFCLDLQVKQLTQEVRKIEGRIKDKRVEDDVDDSFYKEKYGELENKMSVITLKSRQQEEILLKERVQMAQERRAQQDEVARSLNEQTHLLQEVYGEKQKLRMLEDDLMVAEKEFSQKEQMLQQAYEEREKQLLGEFSQKENELEQDVAARQAQLNEVLRDRDFFAGQIRALEDRIEDMSKSTAVNVDEKLQKVLEEQRKNALQELNYKDELWQERFGEKQQEWMEQLRSREQQLNEDRMEMQKKIYELEEQLQRKDAVHKLEIERKKSTSSTTRASSNLTTLGNKGKLSTALRAHDFNSPDDADAAEDARQGPGRKTRRNEVLERRMAEKEKEQQQKPTTTSSAPSVSSSSHSFATFSATNEELEELARAPRLPSSPQFPPPITDPHMPKEEKEKNEGPLPAPPPAAIATSIAPRSGRPDVSGLPLANLAYLEQVEKEGWDTVKWDNDYSLLHWCAKRGMEELCMYLVHFAADPRVRDNKGNSAIDYARMNTHENLVDTFERFLRSYDPAIISSQLHQVRGDSAFDEAQRGDSALEAHSEPRFVRSSGVEEDAHSALPLQPLAASQPRPDVSVLPPDNMVYLLQIEKEGWSSVLWDNGYSLLHWSAKRGLTDMCVYLVGLQADPMIRDSKDRSAIDYATQGGHDTLASVFNTLLNFNQSLEGQRPSFADNESPSGMEMMGGNTGELRRSGALTPDGGFYTLDNRAQEPPSNPDPSMPLSTLPRLTPGASPSRLRRDDAAFYDDPSLGPTQFAPVQPVPAPSLDQVAEPYASAIRLVEEKGWDNMRWTNDFTLLHWAARNGNLEYAEYFLNKGARVNDRDARGKRAVDYAIDRGHTHMVALLQELE